MTAPPEPVTPAEAVTAAFKAVGDAAANPRRVRSRREIVLIALEAAAPLIGDQAAAAERERQAGRERVSAQVEADLVRLVLVAICERDGLPLESAADPGTPARNYELALRLRIGRIFGLPDPAGATANPERTHDTGLPLPPCTCDCRQCGLSCHCSACYKDRRQKALRRALDRAAAAERESIAAELDQRADGLDRHAGEWTDIKARHDVTTLAVTLRNTAAAIRANGHAENLRSDLTGSNPEPAPAGTCGCGAPLWPGKTHSCGQDQPITRTGAGGDR